MKFVCFICDGCGVQQMQAPEIPTIPPGWRYRELSDLASLTSVLCADCFVVGKMAIDRALAELKAKRDAKNSETSATDTGGQPGDPADVAPSVAGRSGEGAAPSSPAEARESRGAIPRTKEACPLLAEHPSLHPGQSCVCGWRPDQRTNDPLGNVPPGLEALAREVQGSDSPLPKRRDAVKAAEDFVEEWLTGDEQVIAPLAEELNDAYNAGYRDGQRAPRTEPAK